MWLWYYSATWLLIQKTKKQKKSPQHLSYGVELSLPSYRSVSTQFSSFSISFLRSFNIFNNIPFRGSSSFSNLVEQWSNGIIHIRMVKWHHSGSRGYLPWKWLLYCVRLCWYSRLSDFQCSVFLRFVLYADTTHWSLSLTWMGVCSIMENICMTLHFQGLIYLFIYILKKRKDSQIYRD